VAEKHVTKAAGDYVRSFAHEDGVDYRHHSQDLGPAIRRVEAIRHAQELRGPNPTGRQYIGSVPMVVIIDWCKKHGYTYEQFARREGTIRQEFMKYFLTRDFSKFHTQHSTTRVGTGNRIVVPNYIGGAHGDNKLRGTENVDS
jgi:hypothetical protein